MILSIIPGLQQYHDYQYCISVVRSFVAVMLACCAESSYDLYLAGDTSSNAYRYLLSILILIL